jgi:hypothetical protein
MPGVSKRVRLAAALTNTIFLSWFALFYILLAFLDSSTAMRSDSAGALVAFALAVVVFPLPVGLIVARLMRRRAPQRARSRGVAAAAAFAGWNLLGIGLFTAFFQSRAFQSFAGGWGVVFYLVAGLWWMGQCAGWATRQDPA